MPVIYRTLRTQICRTICPHPIQSTFSEDRAETTKCFVLGENRTEDIDRCGGTPLDVNFSSESDKNSSFLKKFVLHSSHICTFRIPCAPWCHIAEISDAFETPLPLLRDADLSIGYDLSPTPFERPFLAGATNLVSLRLSDYNINSGTLLHFIIPTLTHLSLSFSEPRILMVGELLEFLRNSPLIEDLQIHADVVLDAPEENSTFPDRFQPVDLLCLRNIHLSWATPRSQHTLLANIQHPPIVPSLCKRGRTAIFLNLRRTYFQNRGTPSLFRISPVSRCG